MRDGPDLPKPHAVISRIPFARAILIFSRGGAWHIVEMTENWSMTDPDTPPRHSVIPAIPTVPGREPLATSIRATTVAICLLVD